MFICPELLNEMYESYKKGEDFNDAYQKFLGYNREKITITICCRRNIKEDNELFSDYFSNIANAILKAVKTYDPSRGMKIENYCYLCMRWNMSDKTKSSTDIKLSRYYNSFAKDPTEEELKKYIDENTNFKVSLKRIREFYYKNFGKSKSDHPVNVGVTDNDEKKKYIRTLAENWDEIKDIVAEVLKKKEFIAFKKRYIEKKTNKQIAKEMNLAPSTTCDLCKDAYNKIIFIDVINALKNNK